MMVRDNQKKMDRRSFIEWASALGLTTIAPTTIAEVAKADDKPSREKPDQVPNDKRGDPTSKITITHPLEYQGMRDRMDQHQQNKNPDVFYHNELVREIRDRDLNRDINISVTTVGESSDLTSKGTFQRKISGWRPTDEEVSKLARFGSVDFVPKIIGSKVSMSDVPIKNLSTIAQLPFVLEVNYDPPIKPNTYRNVDDLRTTSYFWFENQEDNYEIHSDVRIGIMDDGYAGDGNSRFSESHAEKIGIDESLAKDFTDDNDWSDITNNNPGDHGDEMADTCAYMIDPDHNKGHSDLFVPLKIADANDWYSSSAREAIEYALINDIEVLNMSWGGGHYTSCPSSYCSELETYANSGYIALTSSGNLADEGSGVGSTATSVHAISVGGMSDDCSGDEDFERHDNSQYGTVDYYSECFPCYTDENQTSDHHPYVYGCYTNITDSGSFTSGTSPATAQASAAAAIMQSNSLYNYPEARTIFKEMDFKDICPNSVSEHGQLLDAFDARNKTE